ncbi:MAG: hypothetical protein GY748_00625 [Planctomycetaceae bacterium]|nr:hypothetical protein [Planctomycetaceae bacterium]
MRQLVNGALLTAVILLPISNSSLNGQDVTGPAPNALFAPDTPTMWHKLGIPQGIGRVKKYRESRVNRTGNKPQRESKPKLVKLTDAANLSPEGPKVLKAAAEIKMAEDLAPQKIKAIKYLATIGCGCYNKKNADMVETAILEALDDCTADVRREAINLVIKQAGGGCCSCETGCNSKSCCSEKIYNKLDAMANKTDDDGCWLEPDSSIRYLAQRAVEACPLPKSNGGGKNLESEPTPAEIESAELKSASPTVKFQDAVGVDVKSDVATDISSKLEVIGSIRSLGQDAGTVEIVFEQPFYFDEELEVAVAIDHSHASLGEVEGAVVGAATVSLFDKSMMAHLKENQRIYLGVLLPNQLK